jgi:hypothetical protein
LCSLFNDVYVIKRIKISILRWAGYVIRRENEEIIGRIMLVKLERKIKKGRPRMRWLVCVDKDLRNLDEVNRKTKAQ